MFWLPADFIPAPILAMLGCFQQFKLSNSKPGVHSRPDWCVCVCRGLSFVPITLPGASASFQAKSYVTCCARLRLSDAHQRYNDEVKVILACCHPLQHRHPGDASRHSRGAVGRLGEEGKRRPYTEGAAVRNERQFVATHKKPAAAPKKVEVITNDGMDILHER